MIKPGDIVTHDWWARGNHGDWDRPGLVIDVYSVKQLDPQTRTEQIMTEARIEWFSVQPFRNGDVSWGRYDLNDLALYCPDFQESRLAKAPLEWS